MLSGSVCINDIQLFLNNPRPGKPDRVSNTLISKFLIKSSVSFRLNEEA